MQNNIEAVLPEVTAKVGGGKKILLATVPADGHFNPLTGLAKHLQTLGYDVRWYTSLEYAPKLQKLKIPHLPFKRAMEVTGTNLEHVFPERAKMKGQIKKLNFDMMNFFIKRGPEYYADIKEIYESFPFDLMLADNMFTGVPFVSDKMHIPVVSVGVLPLTEASKDLAPAGLGLTPSTSFLGRMKQSALRYMADNFIFKPSNVLMRSILDEYGIEHKNIGLFDLIIRKSTLLLQSGTPGFEYKRSDLSKNVRFIGPILPYQPAKRQALWYDPRLNQYERVVLVTQGTVEKDVTKLLVPTLNAFKDSDALVIATTGGSKTQELQQLYPEPNFIIRDFIHFDDIMPYADVYITNGGYGGVMLGIKNRLPLVVAGIHEGKNEINARIGYFKLGVNLNTERPKPQQIWDAVDEVITNMVYKRNVEALSEEFERYDSDHLCAQYIGELLKEVESEAASYIS
jgi:MGT family glycosyltransferase